MRLRRTTISPGHLSMGGSPRWAYCRTSGGSRKSFTGIGLGPSYHIRGGEANQFGSPFYIIFRGLGETHTHFLQAAHSTAIDGLRDHHDLRELVPAFLIARTTTAPASWLLVLCGPTLLCLLTQKVCHSLVPGAQLLVAAAPVGYAAPVVRPRVQTRSGVVRGSQSRRNQDHVGSAASRCWWHARRSVPPAVSVGPSRPRARPTCRSVPPGRRSRSGSRPTCRRAAPTAPAGYRPIW